MAPIITFAFTWFTGFFLISIGYPMTLDQAIALTALSFVLAAAVWYQPPKRSTIASKLSFRPCTYCTYASQLCEPCAHNKKVIEIMGQMLELK